MALKKTITKDISFDNADMIESTGINIPSSVSLSDVYFRINSLEGNKSKLKINLVGVYTYKIKDADMQQDCDAKEVVYSNSFNFAPCVDDGSANFIKQGYEYLKTLEEFKEAVDC